MVDRLHVTTYAAAEVLPVATTFPNGYTVLHGGVVKEVVAGAFVTRGLTLAVRELLLPTGPNVVTGELAMTTTTGAGVFNAANLQNQLNVAVPRDRLVTVSGRLYVKAAIAKSARIRLAWEGLYFVDGVDAIAATYGQMILTGQFILPANTATSVVGVVLSVLTLDGTDTTYTIQMDRSQLQYSMVY